MSHYANMPTSTGIHKKKKATGDYQKGRELTVQPKQELKAFDVAFSQTNFAQAGNFVALNTPVNGAELYQRVGRKIYMKSLQIRGFIQSSATSTNDLARMIVFFDAQPNTAGPANLATLLQDSNAAAGQTAISEINLTNRQRFKILRDKQFYLPSLTNTAGVLTNVGPQDQVMQALQFNEFIKLKGLETIYNGTNGGTVADITSGSLYVVFLSLNNTNQWSAAWGSRLRYYD